MKLYELAHSRTGDKGNLSTISVIAYKAEDYPVLEQKVTVEKVSGLFRNATKVTRYEIPSLGALNFVLEGTLGGGVTSSVSLDTHGKSLCGLMIELELD